MNLVTMGSGFLWLLIFVYSILGAIDFGSSAWRWQFHLRDNWQAASVASTYLSPTWELINAFLVVIPVALVGLFPEAAYIYGTVLTLPALLLLVLLALRGSYLQFGYASEKLRRHMVWVAGITGILLPGVFVALLPLSQGGYIQRSAFTYTLEVGKFFGSVQVYIYMVFGMLLALYLSALFLAHYSNRAKQFRAHLRFRNGALWAGPLSLIFGTLALYSRTPGGLSLLGYGWQFASFRAALIASLAAFLLTFLSLMLQRQGQTVSKTRTFWQLSMGVAQIVFSQFAYAIGHFPYILYPYLTFFHAASNHRMFLSSLFVLVGGLLVLSPLLLWFRRMFIVDAHYIAAQTEHKASPKS